jgi:hypothetical protein
MTTATLKGEENMTDFQFRSILNFVIKILKSTKNVDDLIKTLEAIRDGKDEEVSGSTKE